MQIESSVLGSAFSEWSELTEQYALGLDAVRRREPGASIRLMELHERMER